MATVEEVARMSLAAVDSQANFLLACQWVSERYQNLCSSIRFRHLRHLGQVTTKAVVSAGTVTVARGDTAIVGDATAQAAWSAELIGRYVRTKCVWYKIKNVTATSLVLHQPFTESDESGASYKIVARQIPLDQGVRHVSDTIVHARMRTPLDNMSMEEMDVKYPERLLVGPPPFTWAQTEHFIDESTGKKTIALEFYPYSTEAETMYFVYWDKPPMLSRGDELPDVINVDEIKEGVLVDIMRHAASEAANAGKTEIAAYWRNEYRAQDTVWKTVTKKISRNNVGVDDLTFILTMTRSHNQGHRDITNARDEVYARGNRP